jgi:hypothetical protein
VTVDIRKRAGVEALGAMPLRSCHVMSTHTQYEDKRVSKGGAQRFLHNIIMESDNSATLVVLSGSLTT